MCGIFGWKCEGKTNRVRQNQTRILASVLAHANDSRGGDSWGAYIGTTYKGLGDMTTCGSQVLNKMARSNICLAHTRKATHGTVSIANAHPFEVGKIVGAHNGVVSNHWDLNRKLGRKCQVDSEHIFLNLDEGRPLHEIDGWGAIEYINKEDPDVVFLGKFYSGDLAVAKVENFGIIWSSDESHLVSALGISGLQKPIFYRTEKGKLYRTQDNELYEDKELRITPQWVWKKNSKSYYASTTSVKTHNDETYDVDARWDQLRESGDTVQYTQQDKDKRPYYYRTCAGCTELFTIKTICDNCKCCPTCCTGYCDRRMIGYGGTTLSDAEKLELASEVNDEALNRYRDTMNPNTFDE